MNKPARSSPVHDEVERKHSFFVKTMPWKKCYINMLFTFIDSQIYNKRWYFMGGAKSVIYNENKPENIEPKFIQNLPKKDIYISSF